MSTNSAVVTGVSTGIGLSIAHSLIANGWHVFGSVRRESDAIPLQEKFGEKFTPLVFDVTDREAINRGAEQVQKHLDGKTLGGLINNAGVAVGGPLRYIPVEELEHQMNVNLFGVLRVTQAFLPMLGADRIYKGKPGKIINMGSVAGKIASPIMGPYSMSKHALEAFTDSLRRELLMHGIDVVALCPGAVATPIWAKADDIDAEQYKSTEYYEILLAMREGFKEYGANGLEPKVIGELARNILEGKSRRPRYAILKDKFLNFTLPLLLPKRMVDKALAKRFGLPTSKTAT